MKNFLIFVLTILISSSYVHANQEKTIQLPSPEFKNNKPLMEALQLRKSNRDFSEKELSIQTISNLLWAASGVNRPNKNLRTAPTAVNWQELDIYVTKADGLYLYNAKEHTLELIMKEDLRKDAGIQEITNTVPLNLIYVADHDKMTGSWVTEETKKFYSATDVGFISQNVYLFCASEGLATVVLGYVDKEGLKKKMQLRENQHIQLTQPVAWPKQ